jgi:hypothetical protein
MAAEEDLTTAAAAAARLGVSSGDAALPGLITAASEALADWLGFPLHRRTGLQETCAGGGQRLFLRAGAVQSITSITCYGTTREASTYRLEDDGLKGVVLALRTPWPFTGKTGGGVSQAATFREDTGDITVSFTAGWVTPGQVALNGALTRDLPAVFEQACITAVTAWYSEKGLNPNITSQTVGNASIGFGGDSIRGGRAALPLNALQLVRRYRKHVR